MAGRFDMISAALTTSLPAIAAPSMVAMRRADMRKALKRYGQQRSNAKRRTIPWQFDFPSWLSTWWESGHWHERGNSHGQYVMSRPGDGLIPYSAATIAIVPCTVNNRDRTPEMTAKRVRDMKGKQYHLGWRHTVSAETRARMSAAQLKVQAKKRALGIPRRRNEPWIAAGTSRSSWYRRRAAEASP
jgi:hypothetical protein